MTEPTRRKRFQIHLSTAIVLMFVAGGLMWANMRKTSESIRDLNRSNSNITAKEIREQIKREGEKVAITPCIRSYMRQSGWPFHFIIERGESVQIFADFIADKGPEKEFMMDYSITNNYFAAFGDVVIAFLTLFLVWYYCEWLIRRRALKKGP